MACSRQSIFKQLDQLRRQFCLLIGARHPTFNKSWNPMNPQIICNSSSTDQVQPLSLTHTTRSPTISKSRQTWSRYSINPLPQQLSQHLPSQISFNVVVQRTSKNHRTLDQLAVLAATCNSHRSSTTKLLIRELPFFDSKKIVDNIALSSPDEYRFFGIGAFAIPFLFKAR